MALDDATEEKACFDPVRVMVLATVVESHNAEVDEEERKEMKTETVRKTLRRGNNIYLNRIVNSDTTMWRDPTRKEYNLERSYAAIKEKDKK